MIVDPLGTVVAGPVYDSEMMLYMDAPAQAALLARRGFDAVGHYGRGDLFSLALRGIPIPLEIGTATPVAAMNNEIWEPTRHEETPGEERLGGLGTGKD